MLNIELRAVLEHKLTIAELIGTVAILAVPYLIIGGVWSATHTEHLQHLQGADRVVSFLGSIASWPILWFSDVCVM
jgi:hypothetical protein